VPWQPTEDERRRYLGRACGELAQAIYELRPEWEEVVRYPDREDVGGWDGIPWNGKPPSHHVAVRTPAGRILDVRGWLNDPRWATAESYERPFELSARDRDTARRLLDAVDPQP
jgi:hypothetical protein